MISVVIPYSEDQTYLVRCVNAVKRQTYKDVQLLVIAAQCDPETVQEYGLEVIENDNGGQYGGINEAVGRAGGEYLYFCNITSVPAPNTLERLLEEYEADRNVLKYGKCYVEKEQEFAACAGMEASCYGKLYDMEIIRDRNIQFRENSAFAEMQFVAEYAAHMEDMVPLESVYIYETDLQWNKLKYIDEGIDVADWKVLLEQIGRLNETINGLMMTQLCEYMESYRVYSKDVFDITLENCDNLQLQYMVAKSALTFWWEEARERNDQEAFENMKACLERYEESEKYFELLLMVCGITQEQYPYLKEKDLQTALYFIRERARLGDSIDLYAEESCKLADTAGTSQGGRTASDLPGELRTGLVKTGSDWYYYRNDEIDWDYVGLAKNPFGWYYVRNGILDRSYYGIVSNRYGAWCVEKGTINRGANGYRRVGRQEAFFTDGKVDSGKNGFIYSNGEWRFYDKGMVDMQYKGLARNEHGWWYVEGGEINYGFEGLAENEYGWWYIKDGTIDYSFKGYALNKEGWHYVEKGTIRDTEPEVELAVRDNTADVPYEEVCAAEREELSGAELAEYAVSKYASGELGIKTIFNSLGAWIKYKL